MVGREEGFEKLILEVGEFGFRRFEWNLFFLLLGFNC